MSWMVGLTLPFSLQIFDAGMRPQNTLADYRPHAIPEHSDAGSWNRFLPASLPLESLARNPFKARDGTSICFPVLAASRLNRS
jgi:hypothetical protein